MVGNQNIWGCTLASGILNIWHVLMDAEMAVAQSKEKFIFRLHAKVFKILRAPEFSGQYWQQSCFIEMRNLQWSSSGTAHGKNIKASPQMLVYQFFYICVLFGFFLGAFYWNIVKGSCLSHRFPSWFSQCCNSQFLVEGCRSNSVISTTKDFSSQEQAML